MATDAHQLGLFQRLSRFTPTLAFLTVYLSLAALNFGYDVGTFGGVQGMQGFLGTFGTYDAAAGKYALPVYLASVMNSTPFFGKLVGAQVCGPLAERWGRKAAVAVMACISLVGVALQTSATTAAQFTVGRIVNFAMTGFCIVVTPIYQSECAPAELRGLITGTIQFQISLGQVVAACVNYGTQSVAGNRAWQIPIGLQFIVPVAILALLPFMPESPRWLVSRNRRADALKSLVRLRSNRTAVQNEEELDLFYRQAALTTKGPWKEVFDKNNRLRTTIAVLAMFFQQITGQAFVSQYSTVFYQKEGYSNAFLLSLYTSIAGLVCTFITSLTVDHFGRRPVLLLGGTLMAVFIFTVGGIGTVAAPTDIQKNATVAGIALFSSMYSLSWAPVSYVVLGEVSSQRVKEKTSNLAVSISVITTFLVSFTLPYLLNAPYANLGAKVGFIYGTACVLSVVATFFFIPEMRNLSLEEVNSLFRKKTPIRRFQEVAKSERFEDLVLDDADDKPVRVEKESKTTVEPVGA